ncbi:hypothetical protein [Silanimonas sp.]|uniref:TlpA family protein disulfide reductase n=1 Tax=Silanimonas sp. TaxID=1929290 RepID=UPI001BC69201|nr:hypothetical protein [Silanimonas sp.]MBS3896925.1 hypothetical protein [Silanimonas sp.]MBS3924102.1 hypothetical protein [Xanthomonadaceae bacterium]
MRRERPESSRHPLLQRSVLIGLVMAILLGVWLRDLPALFRQPPVETVALERPRVDALGTPRQLAEWQGRPVLVAYGAAWCQDCPALVAAAEAAGQRDGLVVLHMLTSTVAGYGHPPGASDAATWAERFGLPPERVWAADLTAKPLPAWTLFDAEGRVRAEHEGPIDPRRLAAALDRLPAETTAP